MDNMNRSLEEGQSADPSLKQDVLHLDTSFRQLDVHGSDEEVDVEKWMDEEVDIGVIKEVQQGSPKHLTTQSLKHALTPESKAAAESKPKRRASYNMSSQQCSKRRGSLSSELENLLEYREDSTVHVQQSTLLRLLDLTDISKNLLTRSIKAAFPDSVKKHIKINDEYVAVYTNIALKSNSKRTWISKELFAEDDDKDMVVIKNQLEDTGQSLVDNVDEICIALNANNVELARTLSVKHNLSLHQYYKYQAAMVTLYEQKVKKLQDNQEEVEISNFQRLQMEKEMKVLEEVCDFGLKGNSKTETIAMNQRIFRDLLENFEDKCPLLHNVLETLLVTDSRKRVHKTQEYKMMCGVNSLALLLSVRNQKCKNDVRLLLGLVCITYGAGKQFVNLLNAIGLTPHWDSLNNFLDEQLKNFSHIIEEKCPSTSPVILLMDNINLYRGKKRHLRLLKDVGSKMWNFTGRAAIIPDVEDLKDFFLCKETATLPQTDISSIEAKDILLDSLPEHKKLWNDWCDRYLLELLNKGLNETPKPPKSFKEMGEVELNSWLSKADFVHYDGCVDKKFKVKVPAVQELCKESQRVNKTDVINLPLSLENNSTLTGTAAIFEEFGKEFSIPCRQAHGIAFSKSDKKFDIKAARARYDFTRSVEMHHAEMSEMKRQLASLEKGLDDVAIDSPADSDSETDDSDDNTGRSVSVNATRTLEHKDKTFAALCDKVTNKVKEIVHSGNDYSISNLVEQIAHDVKEIDNVKDRYERTLFHHAVEHKNYFLVRILLSLGVNPNGKEGCGASPMSLAVMNGDTDMCKILLENFSDFTGAQFGSFSTPLEMATAMELTDIVQLFNEFSQPTKSPIVSLLKTENCTQSLKNQASESHSEDVHVEESLESESNFVYTRSVYEGFPTGIVGDVGTCKVNRSVKNTSNTAYGWSTEIPGDMHAQGHLCEATFKAHGKGGFHKVVHDIMQRPKLTEEAFKKRKFQEQNLQHIKEAVRDGSCAYGLAAVEEFRVSDIFPSDDDLKASLRKNGSHNNILLTKFKNWLKQCGECDERHKYHQQLFTLFGPLQELLICAVKEGDGDLRETAWILLLPVFAQLGFRNYWTESFVHVVNFTSLWPLAFRMMVKQNSSVNVSGKQGHNIALDEYVETYVVRPLKMYASGHTSVQMCKRLMGNLNLLGSIRSVYCHPSAFNYHQTTKHKVESSLPDVVKGMWFCLRNKFFDATPGNIPVEFPLKSAKDGVQRNIPKSLSEIVPKGEEKVKEKFAGKLHESFPSYRYISLESIMEH